MLSFLASLRRNLTVFHSASRMEPAPDFTKRHPHQIFSRCYGKPFDVRALQTEVREKSLSVTFISERCFWVSVYASSSQQNLTPHAVVRLYRTVHHRATDPAPHRAAYGSTILRARIVFFSQRTSHRRQAVVCRLVYIAHCTMSAVRCRDGSGLLKLGRQGKFF